MLIDQIMGESKGNVDYQSIKINWDEYQNKLILVKNNELIISNIKRVF
jgi:hypothetical protein